MTGVTSGVSFEQAYAVAGCGLSITSNCAAIARAVELRLRAFPTRARSPGDLLVDFYAVESPSEHVTTPAPSHARPVYDSPLVSTRYDESLDSLHLECGESARAVCRPDDGRVTVSFVEAAAAELEWLLSHALLTVSLMEMLKRRGIFALHAGGVTVGGKAILLAGASGSGKTTLTLALALAGHGFLGDDIAFLTKGDDGLTVLPFPDQVDVTPDSAALLPELAPLFDVAPFTGRGKRGICMDDLRPAAERRDASPGLLLLPSVSHDGRTRLESVSAATAFLELLPNVLLTEPVSSQAHVDALGRLVAESRCYRIETGRNLAAAVDVVAQSLSA
jgi:energy-coupling factor transporter ATP-binding protein EcfA2